MKSLEQLRSQISRPHAQLELRRAIEGPPSARLKISDGQSLYTSPDLFLLAKAAQNRPASGGEPAYPRQNPTPEPK